MKRSLYIALSALLCILSVLPVTTYAQTYDLPDTDMSISVDDTIWYVFTRDNIEDNAELEELGISYDLVYSALYDNQAYMDAILFYDEGEYVELILMKKALDTDVGNLSEYSDEDVLELAEELAQRQSAEEYSVYHNRYKFAKLEYTDSVEYEGAQIEYNLYQFYTIINNVTYTLSFQSTSPLDEAVYDEIVRVVDGVRFNADDPEKDEGERAVSNRDEPSAEEKAEMSFWDSAIIKEAGGAVIGVAAGVVVGAVGTISEKKKNSRKRSETAPADNIDE